MAETVLVCVTGQTSSERLIHKGAQIAREHQATLLVLSVSGCGMNLSSNPQVMQSLNDLYRLSSEVGAEMTILHHPDARRAICDFARDRSVTRLVVGEGKTQSSFIPNLMRSLPDVSFTIEAMA